MRDLPRRDRQVSHIWGLDIVRFLAALSVSCHHLSWEQPDAQIIFNPGWVGVEIFFVISGFVIMGSAINTTPAPFLEKRIARIYPAAIACALINFAVLRPFWRDAVAENLWVSGKTMPFIASLALIKGPYMVVSLWTLPIEFAFYALIAVMLYFRLINHVVAFSGGLIIWSGLYLIPATLSAYAVVPFHVFPMGYGLINLTLWRHGCFFGVGVLLWHVLMRQPGPLVSQLVAYGLLGLGIIVCWAEIAGRSVELKPLYAYQVDVRALTAGTLATFTLALAAIIGFVKINERIRPGPNTTLMLRQLGLMTYPLYLLHEGVGGVTFALLRQAGYAHGLAMIAGIIVSLVVSLLVVIAIEPVFKRWLMGAIHPLFTPRAPA